MRPRTARLAAAALLALLAPAAPAAAHACRPAVIDLGTLPGDRDSAVLAIGPDRETVGLSIDYGDHTRAVRWTRRGIEALRVPDTGDSVALDVNASGVIVGAYGQSDDTSRAFVWSDGRITSLPGLLPEGAGTYARRITDRGVIAGSAFDGAGHEHAVLWRAGRIVELSPPPGFENAFAMDVSDRGAVVGGAYSDTANVAVRWRAGHVRVLPTLGGDGAQASVLDRFGRVAGLSQTASGLFEGTVWDRAGRPSGIGFLGHGDDDDIRGTDGAGGYVGGANLSPGGTVYHVFIARAGGVPMTLPSVGAGPLGRSGAHALDVEGDVGGSSETATGTGHATLWTCAWRQAFVP